VSLRVDSVSLRIGQVPLLADISFRVADGEVLAIIGPNGAGKSTLLRLLSGDTAPTAGAVLFNGRPVGAWRGEDKARSMAVLPQAATLSFPFTVEEVVMLGRTPHRTGLRRDLEVVREALQAVDGGHLLQRIYTQLSGGEKQRVQLARVLAQIWDPDGATERLLILDEPTASFDMAHQQLTLGLVKQLSRQGIGIVLVVHDLTMAARCADNLLLLSCGRVAAHGSADQVLTEALVSEVFQVAVSIQHSSVTGDLWVAPR